MDWEADHAELTPAVVRVPDRPDPTPVDPRAHAFLDGLVHGMRCGILAIDPEHRLLLLNRIGRDVLALPDADCGAHVSQALADHPQLAKALETSFAMESLPNRAELATGNGKRIGFTLSRVQGPGGRPCGIAMFFKDLTQIEHEEEQNRVQDRLAALGQMAANVAHEIRNPLASIEVTCGLLKRRLGPDTEAQNLLGKIVAEVRRLNATVNSNLEFVRPLRPNLAAGRLGDVIADSIRVASDRSGRPGVRVEDRHPGRSPEFLMDRALLRQVFENLLLNAFEAVADDGRITITTEVIDAPSEASVPYRPDGTPHTLVPRVEQFAVVRVVDDGPGIEEEDLDRIFNPMFTTKKQGSGIGLAVVRKIVDSHRGLIEVESRPGHGAAFSVRLPMAQPSPEARGK